MTTDSTTTDDDANLFLGAAWFDPIEAGIRGQIRGLIGGLIGEELAAAPGRKRYERRSGAPQPGRLRPPPRPRPVTRRAPAAPWPAVPTRPAVHAARAQEPRDPRARPPARGGAGRSHGHDPRRARPTRSRRGTRPPSASGGSSAGRPPTARRKPARSSSPSPARHPAGGSRPGRPTPFSGYAYSGKSTPGPRERHRPGAFGYGAYRCIGGDGHRFDGAAVCANRPVRSDRLERAIWTEVEAVLEEPGRVAHEYR